MNPLLSIVAAFTTLRTDVLTRFNAAIAKLPPVEQIESGNVALNVLRELDWGKDRLERMGAELETTLNAAASVIQGFEKKAGETVEVTAGRLHEALLANAATAAIAAAITAKTIVPFEDHQTALQNMEVTAKEAGKNEAETDFNAKVSDLEKITERRAAAIEKVGVLAASKIKDSDLLADNHADIFAAVEGRIAKMATVNITAETKPKNFESLLACGYDADGIAQFEARFEMLSEGAPSADLNASRQDPKAPKPSSKFGVLPGGGDPAAPKKTVI